MSDGGDNSDDSNVEDEVSTWDEAEAIELRDSVQVARNGTRSTCKANNKYKLSLSQTTGPREVGLRSL